MVRVGKELALPNEGLVGGIPRDFHVACDPGIAGAALGEVLGQTAFVVRGIHLKTER